MSTFVGEGLSFLKVLDMIKQVRDHNFPVFINGESGTGKELVAQMIHESGNRKKGKFVAINCGAIPDNLLESEIFGHTRGAFTGAVRTRPGLVEEAEGGTFFLDEIGDLSFHLQAKMLRLFQEKESRRIGENNSRRIDVRFISATNKNIEKEIEKGRFREDLYYRLKIISIDLLPLRKRKEEIEFFLKYFLKIYCMEMNRPLLKISSCALNHLTNYLWPGNVRELQNEVQRCLIYCRTGDFITKDDLSPKIRNGEKPLISRYAFFHARNEFEKSYIHEALRQCDFHRIKTAKNLGLSRQGLFKLIKKHNIEIPKKKL